MKDKKNTGSQGEKLAAGYLLQNGYKVIEKNFRYKRSEIDIICQKDKILVFVEVKTRTNTFFGYPEDFVDENKMDNLHRAASAYIEKCNWQHDIRFDIISITKRKNTSDIQHFEDVV